MRNDELSKGALTGHCVTFVPVLWARENAIRDPYKAEVDGSSPPTPTLRVLVAPCSLRQAMTGVHVL